MCACWLKIKKCGSLGQSGLHFFDTKSWYSLTMKGKYWKQEDEMPYSLSEFVVEQQGRRQSLLSRAAHTGCVLVVQLGLSLLLLFRCKQALLLDDTKVVFCVFGHRAAMCGQFMSLRVFFLLWVLFQAGFLLVYSFLRAEMVFSSFICPSSFLDVSLKTQLLADGLQDEMFILNWLESTAFEVGSLFVMHM